MRPPMPKPGSPTVKLSESAAGAARAARARSAPAPQARAPAAPAEGPLNFTMVKLGFRMDAACSGAGAGGGRPRVGHRRGRLSRRQLRKHQQLDQLTRLQSWALLADSRLRGHCITSLSTRRASARRR